MTVKYLHEFLVELDGLDKAVRKRVRKKLDEVSRASFGGFPHQPLKGDQFKGLFKLRVGDWRLIYRIETNEILFITLGHRSEVYE